MLAFELQAAIEQLNVVADRLLLLLSSQTYASFQLLFDASENLLLIRDFEKYRARLVIADLATHPKHYVKFCFQSTLQEAVWIHQSSLHLSW